MAGWAHSLMQTLRAQKAAHTPLQQLAPLFQSPDPDAIQQALELTTILDSPPLYNALLRGTGTTKPDEDGYTTLKPGNILHPRAPRSTRTASNAPSKLTRWATLQLLAAAPPSTPAAQFCRSVRALSVQQPTLDPALLTAFPSLERLRLHRVRTWQHPEHFAALASLHTLQLLQCAPPTAPTWPAALRRLHIRALHGPTNLSFLSDAATREAHSALEVLELTHLPTLQALAGIPTGLLQLSVCWAESLTHIGALQGCDRLTRLVLRGCVPLQRLDGLRGLSRLRDVALAGCPHLTSLSGLPPLDVLHLSQVPGEILSSVPPVRTLHWHDHPASPASSVAFQRIPVGRVGVVVLNPDHDGDRVPDSMPGHLRGRIQWVTPGQG